jgi:phospholipid transport system substrate-binding protein
LAAAHPAQQLVMDTTGKVLERLRAEHDKLQADNGRIYPLVEELILPHFDFHKMSIWVLGKNWRRATPAQQKTFTREFQTLLVRTYATALLQYTDQTIDYLPFHAAEGDRRVVVRTEIVQKGGHNIPLNYSMYLNNDGQWMVYDISVDGVSLVTNYRSTFASEINKGGIDLLLANLAEKNRQGEQAGE